MTCAFFSVAYLFIFALHYIPNYLTGGEVFIYISYFTEDFGNSFLPVLAAFFSVIAFLKIRPRRAFSDMALYSVISFLYVLPKAYVEYMYQGYTSTDAVFYAFVQGLLNAVILYVYTLLLLLLILFLIMKFAKEKTLFSEKAKLSLSSSSPFDFNSPLSSAMFVAAVPGFIYSFIIEVVDTAKYITRYDGGYRGSEIVYIVIRYLFILLTLILTEVAIFALKRACTDRFFAGERNE